MRVLALDASFGACSAALLVDGVVFASLRCDRIRAATSALPELAAGVLASGVRLDMVAVTVGPGSFTGIRAGLSLAHGLALGAGVPVMGVTTIETLILQATVPDAAWSGRTLWVAIDDHRGRCYLARAGSTADPAVETVDPLSIGDPGHAIAILGDAATGLAATLHAAGADVMLLPIDTIDIARVGEIGARRGAGRLMPLAPQPWYLEPPGVRLGAPPRPAPV